RQKSPVKTSAKKKASAAKGEDKPLTAAQRLDAIGIDAICERLTAGESQKAIANSLGIWASHFAEWLAADEERSARAREARTISARHWDDQAESVLLEADEDKPGSIAKARELASHYRWRASKYAPKDYGEKLALSAEVTVQTMTDEQLAAKAAALQAKLGIGNAGN
ncbi:MAG: hypothetical protein IPM06_18790, partial [Rhizobiales bacterium]|nr:hypothetical protein [Hyphomicrobiales bacterium]